MSKESFQIPPRPPSQSGGSSRVATRSSTRAAKSVQEFSQDKVPLAQQGDAKSEHSAESKSSSLEAAGRPRVQTSAITNFLDPPARRIKSVSAASSHAGTDSRSKQDAGPSTSPSQKVLSPAESKQEIQGGLRASTSARQDARIERLKNFVVNRDNLTPQQLAALGEVFTKASIQMGAGSKISSHGTELTEQALVKHTAQFSDSPPPDNRTRVSELSTPQEEQFKSAREITSMPTPAMDKLNLNPTYQSGEKDGRVVATFHPNMLTADYIASEKARVDNLIHHFNVQQAPRLQVPTQAKYESLGALFDHMQAQTSGNSMDTHHGPSQPRRFNPSNQYPSDNYLHPLTRAPQPQENVYQMGPASHELLPNAPAAAPVAMPSAPLDSKELNKAKAPPFDPVLSMIWYENFLRGWQSLNFMYKKQLENNIPGQYNLIASSLKTDAAQHFMFSHRDEIIGFCQDPDTARHFLYSTDGALDARSSGNQFAKLSNMSDIPHVPILQETPVYNHATYTGLPMHLQNAVRLSSTAKEPTPAKYSLIWAFVIVVEKYCCVPTLDEMRVWETAMFMGMSNILSQVSYEETPNQFLNRVNSTFSAYKRYDHGLRFQTVSKRDSLEVYLMGIPQGYRKEVEKELARAGVDHLTKTEQLLLVANAVTNLYSYDRGNDRNARPAEARQPRVQNTPDPQHYRHPQVTPNGAQLPMNPSGPYDPRYPVNQHAYHDERRFDRYPSHQYGHDECNSSYDDAGYNNTQFAVAGAVVPLEFPGSMRPEHERHLQGRGRGQQYPQDRPQGAPRYDSGRGRGSQQNPQQRGTNWEPMHDRPPYNGAGHSQQHTPRGGGPQQGQTPKPRLCTYCRDIEGIDANHYTGDCTHKEQVKRLMFDLTQARHGGPTQAQAPPPGAPPPPLPRNAGATSISSLKKTPFEPHALTTFVEVSEVSKPNKMLHISPDAVSVSANKGLNNPSGLNPVN